MATIKMPHKVAERIENLSLERFAFCPYALTVECRGEVLGKLADGTLMIIMHLCSGLWGEYLPAHSRCELINAYLPDELIINGSTHSTQREYVCGQ